jgi:pimeloyl-ACP methyl ester carboxylesterase
MTNKYSLPLTLDFAAQHSTYHASYLEKGEGVPLLLLHGFLGDAACWLPLIDRLHSHARCVGLDLLGFGDSSKPILRYDIAREVAFVRQFVTAIGLEPCCIVGHSFGGWVATAYALQYPDAVQGLILAASAGIRDDSFCGRYTHLRPLLWRTPLVDWALGLAKPLAGLLGQSASVNRIRWFRQELMANPAACSFLLDRLRPEDAIDTVENQIEQLRVPTLVVTGDRDGTIPLWHSQTYADRIPGAKLVILPDADHALPQKYAFELGELTRKFLHL